jgi:PBP1b-binding outer membrane lipoprotein LpoB
MKKILIAVALLLAGCDSANAGPEYSQPVDSSPTVEMNRFEIVETTGFIDRIITDHKTGCQFLAVGANDWQMMPLGCFDEYKTK